MIAIHITASAQPELHPFTTHSHYAALWESLRVRFPDAIACALMPDHVHLILPATHLREVTALKQRFAVCLRSFARRTYRRSIWQPVSPPREIPDLLHLKRQVRYVHRNSCRAHLTADPTTWLWTTHRDVLGMVWPAWISENRMAALLRESQKGFRGRFHYYVSADQPTPRGTPLITEESRLLAEAAPDRLREATRISIRNDKERPLILAAVLRSQPESTLRLRSHARALKIPASTLSRQGRRGLKLVTPEIRTALALTLKESVLKSGTPRATSPG